MVYWHILVPSLLLDDAPCTHSQHQSYIVASPARGGFAPALRHVLNYKEENAASKQPLDASGGPTHLQTTTLLTSQQVAHPRPFSA